MLSEESTITIIILVMVILAFWLALYYWSKSEPTGETWGKLLKSLQEPTPMWNCPKWSIPKKDKLWHPSTEKPTFIREYADPTVKILALYWYDGFIPFLCELSEDGKLKTTHDSSLWPINDIDYWCYVDDLINILETEHGRIY